MSDSSGDSSSSSDDYNAAAAAGNVRRRQTRSSRRTSSNTNVVHPQQGNSQKKRIVMRVQYDDSDEEETSSSGGEEDDAIKPCSSSSKKLQRNGKNYFESSSNDEEENGDGGGDDDGSSSSGSEVIRSSTLRGKRFKKTVISEDEMEANTSTANATRCDEAGFTSDSSNNELSEKCPICLFTFRAQEVGNPSTCDHTFCLRCIEEWSRNVQTCPIDRLEFESIIVRKTFENRTIVREIKVQKAVQIDLVDEDENDITPCEICTHSDREDVMLLCDTCNQGYHMDCLSPPLSNIPEGSWYCDNCFDSNDSNESEVDLNFLYEDMREMGIPENRLTITELYQPRILRTRQNERIRANILARTRSSRRIASTANATNTIDPSQPSTSRGTTASTSTRTRKTPATRKKPVRKRKTRKRRARARTYVVEYDVNNFDEKFEIKTQKKLVRRKRKSRKTRKPKTRRGRVSKRAGGTTTRLSASKRLAEQLGVLKPAAAGTFVKSQNFTLFGGANDLEYFSDSDSGLANEIDMDMGDGTAVRTAVRLGNISGHRNRKGIAASIDRIPAASGAPDLLSSILDLQDRWHTAARHLDNVQIGSDGSLNLQISNNPPSTQTSEINQSDVTEAPMYPRGGGGGGGGNNYSGGGGYNNNNRYNNQSNYRGGGSGGGGGGAGGGGNSNHQRYSTGGMDGGNRGGFNNSFGRENVNFSFNNSNQNANQNNFTPYNRDRFNRNNQNQRNMRNNRNNQNFNNRNPNQNANTIFNRSFPSRINDSISNENNMLYDNDMLGSDNVNVSNSLPTYGPENCPPPLLANAESTSTSAAATIPLAPPPWNKTLFQLTAAYADDEEDDDDSNCPNFSIYSAETQQVAISSQESTEFNAQPVENAAKEDENNEDEDLVQLGDDDEIPDGIDNNTSVAYEPEEPTQEDDEEEEDDDDDKEKSTSVQDKSDDIEGMNDAEFLAEIKLPDEEPGNANKKAELELHDDSDWEELAGEKPVDDDQKADEDTETVNELDRSYTPCLDENNDPAEEEDEVAEGGTPEIHTIPNDLNTANDDDEDAQKPNEDAAFGTIETELISDDDTLNEQPSKKRDDDDRNSDDRRRRGQQFKKVTGRQRERNYRVDKPRSSPVARRRRSRSRTNDKENDGGHRRNRNDRKRTRREELPRYDVRNVIGQRSAPNEDRFGRTRPARSRSRSGSRDRRRRSRSRSITPKRARRSFSISLSPAPAFGGRRSPPRRASYSPRRSISRSRKRSSRSPPRRSPIRRRSRSAMRLRSRSNSVSKFNGGGRNGHMPRRSSFSSRSKSRSPGFTPSPARSPLRRAAKGLKPKKPKDRKKRNTRLKVRSSTQPSKKKRQTSPKQRSPMMDQAWSPSPSPVQGFASDQNIGSWTPPLHTAKETLLAKSKNKEKKKRTDKKKKKTERRRGEEPARKEKRRRRASEAVDSQTAAPSKEVFASGNNILVSVSFNKEGTAPQQTTVVTLPPTRQEVVSSILQSDRLTTTRKTKKGKEKPTTRKHRKIDIQPVAIIDLERSPFQVTQPNSEVIILTDSDGEHDENDDALNSSQNADLLLASHQDNNIGKSPELERLEQNITDEPYEILLQQQGPKTPPEPPVVKFALSNKNKLKSRNPLHEVEVEDNAISEAEQDCCEHEEIENNILQSGGGNKIGPNTPPDSGPCSPDVYDPFDPTKSPSMSPRSPPPATAEISQGSLSETEPQLHSSTEEGRQTALNSSQEKALNPVDLVMSLVKPNISLDTTSISIDSQFNNQSLDDSLLEQSDDQGGGGGIQVFLPSSNKSSQHIPAISSPISKSLPMSKGTTGSSGSSRLNGGADDFGNEIESPYSPGSADYEDLFEPPPDGSGGKRNRGGKKSKKIEVFDNLFGSSSPVLGQPRMPSYTASAVRKHSTKSSRRNAKGKNGEEEVPNSAVDLHNKDKFLRKLNRQERVVEEVKLVLKPHYNKKHITKEDYKEIMRRSVPKICHSRSGEINPKKIQNLIEAYVKKFRQKNKLSVLNTGQVSSAVKCAAYLKKL